MKSFCKLLFPPASVDLLPCYICLHWLDSSDTESIQKWKGWARAETHADFVFPTKTTAPLEAKERWQQELAKRHLATFLALRARELRPGAEGVLMMVGAPNQFVCPSTTEPQSLPPTLAMQRCVDQGLPRKQASRRTLIPCCTRTVKDVREAVEMASTVPTHTGSPSEGVEHPGSLLSLADTLAHEVTIGKKSATEDYSNFEGGFNMFWSIHQGSIAGAGATKAELEAVRVETRRTWGNAHDKENGIDITHLACVIQWRTRKAWS